MERLRVYTEDECAVDGYPRAWFAIKTLVRDLAGDRCVRCRHPYRVGEHGNGEWSPCDERCIHDGPVRAWGDSDSTPWPDAELQAGRAEGVRFEAQWRILTVHHLTGSKADCRWWNLASLCQRCHLQIQGRVRMEQVYPHEHSPWFKPYAAGYYAATYLGEDLTREETESRQDELLALERVA